MKMFIKLLIFVTAIGLCSACFVEMKRPPAYAPLEKMAKIEGGDEYKEAAKKASDNFHDIYEKGNPGDLFKLLDDKSQLKGDVVYWDIRFNKIRSELGKLEKAEVTRANVFQKSETIEVRIEYRVKFEKEDGSKVRHELFFWELYKNGDVKLLNYMNFIDNEKEY